MAGITRETMLKLSFILPCYNVDRYIADCLNSIYAQDLSEDEYEVICVNDCSADGTRSVISEYASRHPNLKLIDHSENLTAGGARNSGINVARGEYIWFVDPDDMIKPGCVDELIERMEKGKLDLLMFNFEDVDENLNPIKEELFLGDSEVMTGQEYVLSRFKGRFGLLGIVWRCIFRTQFIYENQLAYPLIRKSQDVVFIWKAILKARRLQSVKSIYYTFRINPHSVTHISRTAVVVFSERVLFGKEIIDIMKDKSYGLCPELVQELNKSVLWCANTNVGVIARLSKNEWSNYYLQMKRNNSALKLLRPFENWKNRMVLRIGFGEWEWKLRARWIVSLSKMMK
jgi:glycosyltransferase involved in cell wall biosynthesis